MFYYLSSDKWTYWENSEIPTKRTQRPPRLKYIMLHTHFGRWYLEILERSEGYSRKKREAHDKIGQCQKIGFQFSGIILIINNEQLIEDIDFDSWPLDIAITLFSRI